MNNEEWNALAYYFGDPPDKNNAQMRALRKITNVSGWQQHGFHRLPVYDEKRFRDMPHDAVTKMLEWNELVEDVVNERMNIDKLEMLQSYVDGEIKPGSQEEYFLYQIGLLNVGSRSDRFVLTRRGKKLLRNAGVKNV